MILKLFSEKMELRKIGSII